MAQDSNNSNFNNFNNFNNSNFNNQLPSNDPCREFTQDYLQRYFRRKLFVEQVVRLEQHIMSCKACLERLNACGNETASGASNQQSLQEIKDIVEFLKSRQNLNPLALNNPANTTDPGL
jgi:hypothetical protein